MYANISTKPILCLTKTSEKVKNKVKNRVWGFAPCLASKRRNFVFHLGLGRLSYF